MADHSTWQLRPLCNIAACSRFLLIADTHRARLQAADDQEAWAEGALQRRRAQVMRASGSSGRGGTTEDLGWYCNCKCYALYFYLELRLLL